MPGVREMHKEQVVAYPVGWRIFQNEIQLERHSTHRKSRSTMMYYNYIYNFNELSIYIYIYIYIYHYYYVNSGLALSTMQLFHEESPLRSACWKGSLNTFNHQSDSDTFEVWTQTRYLQKRWVDTVDDELCLILFECATACHACRRLHSVFIREPRR